MYLIPGSLRLLISHWSLHIEAIENITVGVLKWESLSYIPGTPLGQVHDILSFIYPHLYENSQTIGDCCHIRIYSHHPPCHQQSKWPKSTQDALAQTWHLLHWFYCQPGLSSSPGFKSQENFACVRFLPSGWAHQNSSPQQSPPKLLQSGQMSKLQSPAKDIHLKPCLSSLFIPVQILDEPSSPSILNHNETSNCKISISSTIACLIYFLGSCCSKDDCSNKEKIQ